MRQCPLPTPSASFARNGDGGNAGQQAPSLLAGLVLLGGGWPLSRRIGDDAMPSPYPFYRLCEEW
jgi:hypothetical protein